MGITEIIKGHLNEALESNKDLSEERLTICKDCPLFKKKSYGMTCNANLYLNPETNETSFRPKPGFYKGCGCRLKAKTTLEDAHCPAYKW